jgi:hypothetical protein
MSREKPKLTFKEKSAIMINTSLLILCGAVFFATILKILSEFPLTKADFIIYVSGFALLHLFMILFAYNNKFKEVTL